MFLSPPRSTLFPYTTLFRSSSFGSTSSSIKNSIGIRISSGVNPLLVKKSLNSSSEIFGLSKYIFKAVVRVSLTGVKNNGVLDRKSTRLNSSHVAISYAVFFLNVPVPTAIYTLSLHDALPIFFVWFHIFFHKKFNRNKNFFWSKSTACKEISQFFFRNIWII